MVASAKAGNTRALGQLYDAYAEPLFVQVLLPKLGDVASAEDALAETFRTGIEKLGQFEPRGASIYFWFARIAQNKAMDMHRRRAVRARTQEQLEVQWRPLLDCPISPEEALVSRDLFGRYERHLSRCLDDLNERYRRAIELRYFQELSRQDCATAMSVRVATFDVLILRALKALRARWEQGSEGAQSQ